jgi:hypothetical protein
MSKKLELQIPKKMEFVHEVGVGSPKWKSSPKYNFSKVYTRLLSIHSLPA